MRTSELTFLFELKKAMLNFEKEIAICESEIQEIEKEIAYQTTHQYDTTKICINLKIKKTRLEFLKAQRESVLFDLTDFEKTHCV